MYFRDHLQATAQVPVPARVKERRRPERNEHVSPELIPLLRSPVPDNTPAPPSSKVDEPPPHDDLRVARGIVIVVALSIPLWAGIAAIVWAVLH